MNIQDLIAQIQAAANGATGNVTINVNLNQPEMVADDVATDDDTPALPDTDFALGDAVDVFHLRKDGVTVTHTTGTVIEVQGCDDKGWYTRVEGDNGKHYKTGLKYNEARLGSFIAD
jgi:hypothetical protein